MRRTMMLRKRRMMRMRKGRMRTVSLRMQDEHDNGDDDGQPQNGFMNLTRRMRMMRSMEMRMRRRMMRIRTEIVRRMK
eukprot:2963491-Pyramimonas_sp.AAC.1